jgi:hypothetical protein
MQLRDGLGLVAGSKVDVSLYGDGIHLSPSGRTARLEPREGHPVARSLTPSLPMRTCVEGVMGVELILGAAVFVDRAHS